MRQFKDAEMGQRRFRPRMTRAGRLPLGQRMDPDTYRHLLVQGLMDLAAQRQHQMAMSVPGAGVAVSDPGMVPVDSGTVPDGAPMTELGSPPSKLPYDLRSAGSNLHPISAGDMSSLGMDWFGSPGLPRLGPSLQSLSALPGAPEDSPSRLLNPFEAVPKLRDQSQVVSTPNMNLRRDFDQSPRAESAERFTFQAAAGTDSISAEPAITSIDDQPYRTELDVPVFFESGFKDRSKGEQKQVTVKLPATLVKVGDKSYRVDETEFKDIDHALFASMFQAVEIAKANRPSRNKKLTPEAAMSIQVKGEGADKTYTQSRFRVGPCKERASEWSCSSVGMAAGKDSVAVFHLQPPDKRTSSQILNYDKSNKQNLMPTEADWDAYDEMAEHVGPALKFYIVDPEGGAQEFYRDENGEEIVTEKWPKGTFSWKKLRD